MDSVPTRLAVFLVALVVLFGAAFGAGRAVGPIGSNSTTSDPSPVTSTPSGDNGDPASHGGSGSQGGQDGHSGTPTGGGHG